jgi:thimet oligopeptidase
MKKFYSRLAFFITIICISNLNYCSEKIDDNTIVNKAFNVEDIISLFALTPEDIKTQMPIYMQQAQQVIDAIIAVPDDQRTFANTAKPLDEVDALSNLALAQRIYESLEMLSPDAILRDAVREAYIAIRNFRIDTVTSNKKLYNAFMAYANVQAQTEKLSDQQRYFIQNTIQFFKRSGLALPDDVLAQVNVLTKELSALTSTFNSNIAQDNSFITVIHEELQGLGDDFIATLTQTEDGYYKLGIDYPTYFRVMENCSIAATRKKLYIAFYNRAYPINDDLLKTIIIKRDELSMLLGYQDFAHYDLDDQMAKTPEHAEAFITDLLEKSVPKIKAEIAVLTQELPKSIVLTEDGKIQPWDLIYLYNNHKRNCFNIEEHEYFPMQKTIDELLDIYRQFFSIDFQQVAATGLWAEDVIVIRVTDSTGNKTLGTLLLDLHPRPNKYSHASDKIIIPGIIKENGSLIPNVSIVIANFPRPTATQPSLLKRADVKTFFHEFGHALHDVLGVTSIASLSGTQTKRDFVELPSQMLEEWLMDKDILKKISGHYQTGEPLPDDIIDVITSMKNFSSGNNVRSEGFFAMISLSYFGSGESKDPYTIMKQLYDRIMTPMAFCPENHIYTSFGHLTGYGAKYYGYLWSKVFALDLFAEIKKHGLLNPEIGQKYIKEILSKGGAQDPNELLYNFLGREPNSQAFLLDMGLDVDIF